MADIITKESADAANSNVKQRIDEFRKTIDYLLSAFEKSGTSRDHKGRYCKRTLEENYELMIAFLLEAYESPLCIPRLSDNLDDIYMDASDFSDHFIAYEHEHGENLDPRNAMFTLDFAAQEIAALILAEKIGQWNSKTTAELKQFRDDLVTRLRKDWERASARYKYGMLPDEECA